MCVVWVLVCYICVVVAELRNVCGVCMYAPDDLTIPLRVLYICMRPLSSSLLSLFYFVVARAVPINLDVLACVCCVAGNGGGERKTALTQLLLHSATPSVRPNPTKVWFPLPPGRSRVGLFLRSAPRGIAVIAYYCWPLHSPEVRSPTHPISTLIAKSLLSTY